MRAGSSLSISSVTALCASMHHGDDVEVQIGAQGPENLLLMDGDLVDSSCHPIIPAVIASSRFLLLFFIADTQFTRLLSMHMVGVQARSSFQLVSLLIVLQYL